MTSSRRTRFRIVNTGGQDRWKEFGQFPAGSYPLLTKMRVWMEGGDWERGRWRVGTRREVDGGWGLGERWMEGGDWERGGWRVETGREEGGGWGLGERWM